MNVKLTRVASAPIRQRQGHFIVVCRPGDNLHLHPNVRVLFLEAFDHGFHRFAVRPGKPIPKLDDCMSRRISGDFGARRAVRTAANDEEYPDEEQ